MFKEPFDIVPLENHSDPRGTLFEILRFKDQKVPGEGYLYTFTINRGQRRGDHYHTKKLEWFTCVAGEAVVLLEDKDGNKKKIVLSAAAPAIIYCGPYTSHALYNEKKEIAVIVSYGSKQHDPVDPDTFKKFIDYDTTSVQ
jgi:UDP-2-acetamido-2,6-beta-L-arabino-hexul-4-ose reductase